MSISPNPAHPKVIPVVAAICPSRLNHPVTQLINGTYFFGAKTAAQKYGPPALGIAETISAIANPTNTVKKLTTTHPTDITPGPPVVRPYWKRVVMPVMTDIMLKETPKLCTSDQPRLSSCL